MARMRFIKNLNEAEKPKTKVIMVKTRAVLPLAILCALQTIAIIYLLLK